MTKANKIMPDKVKRTPSCCGYDIESDTNELFWTIFFHMESKVAHQMVIVSSRWMGMLMMTELAFDMAKKICAIKLHILHIAMSSNM
jgi:hypothetical protein